MFYLANLLEFIAGIVKGVYKRDPGSNCLPSISEGFLRKSSCHRLRGDSTDKTKQNIGKIKSIEVQQSVLVVEGVHLQEFCKGLVPNKLG